MNGKQIPTSPPCPLCGERAATVQKTTLLHQLRYPHGIGLSDGPFHFCSGTDCPIVYFGHNPDEERFDQSHLRQSVGQKSADLKRMLCYCFDITYAQVAEELAAKGQSAAKNHIEQQTRMKRCACDVRNPSGKCCLNQFP